MKNKKLLMVGAAVVVVVAVVVGVLVSSSSSKTTTLSLKGTCGALTKSVVVADGFTNASGPTITKYDYNNLNANAANSLGTTIDFGKGALVVACVSPSDIAKLSASAQAAGKPTMTAQQYMDYMVAQSAGAMTATPVGGVTDYLDFGNGKEDGLGSTATATSVRLDAWVANKFIILTFIHPASATPSAALLNFITTTQTVL